MTTTETEVPVGLKQELAHHRDRSVRRFRERVKRLERLINLASGLAEQHGCHTQVAQRLISACHLHSLDESILAVADVLADLAFRADDEEGA